MEEKIIDSMSETSLAPADFITLMFERTDEDGILYIPGWHYDRPCWESNAPGSTDENDSYRCRVDWNLAKYEKLLKKFNEHYSKLQQIAKKEKEADDNNKPFELEGELYDFWNTYLKPFDNGGLDLEKIRDIDDRLETIEWVKVIAGNIAKGNSLKDYEKEVLTESIDIKVGDDELKYRENYYNIVLKDAENRIGTNICAYDVVVRSMRLYGLFYLNAPQIIINNEARELAAAFVLHEYGVSRELVDNTVRLRLEQMELMTEEELDELYRPQKANTRKSLAPLFVYEILSKHSNSKTHLRQNDILKKLSEYPYEISLERKALSRIIHNLTDSPRYAIFQDKSGVWVDKED